MAFSRFFYLSFILGELSSENIPASIPFPLVVWILSLSSDGGQAEGDGPFQNRIAITERLASDHIGSPLR